MILESEAPFWIAPSDNAIGHRPHPRTPTIAFAMKTTSSPRHAPRAQRSVLSWRSVLSGTVLGALLCAAPLVAQSRVGVVELRKQLHSHDYRVYEAGLEGFLRLGPAACPSLVAILRKNSEAQQMPRPARLAAHGLSRLGHRATAVIPDLMRELPRGSDAYFRLVAQVLGRVGPHAPKLRPAIQREILRRGEGQLGWDAVAIAVSRLDLSAKANQVELTGALLGADCAKKVMACEILAQRGTDADWAGPDLRQLLRVGRHGRMVHVTLEDGIQRQLWSPSLDDELVNCELAHALVRVSRNKDVPIDAFVQLLAHPKPEFRRDAAVGLGVRGRGALPAVLDLVRSATESRDRVAWEAITALGQIGPQAEVAIPHLEYLARGGNRGRAVRASAALVQIRGK